ncbi:MAG: YihY/virulence factor BrkB family protein [Janthinobacterium lividum]
MREKLEHPAIIAVLGAAGLLMGAYAKQSVGPASGPPDEQSPRDGAGAAGDDGRGSNAAKPSNIPAQGWWDILKRTAKQVSADRVMTEAAGVTFFALLSVFPALAALVSLYGLVADPATIEGQVKSLAGVMPQGGLSILSDQIHTLISVPRGKLGFGVLIGLATSLWSANQGMKALFDALNVVNDEEETRSFLKRTAVTLGFTLGALVFVVLAMAAVVVLPAVLAFVGLGSVVELLLRALRWPLLLGVIAVLLAMIYRYGPDRERARWQWVSWGSGFAAVAWVVGSAAFSWYVANFGSYDKTYGSLGAVIGFMTWLWISTIIVLTGAELNTAMEEQTGRDTTTGPERAPGSRGATKADRMARA